MKHVAAKTIQPDERPQVAAICVREQEGRTEVLLVTSRDTGRWIVPKGWTMAGKPDHRAAEIEAWEEAGVRGSIAKNPIGKYRYIKVMKDEADVVCVADVYTLDVETIVNDFPEADERRRKWLSPEDAAKRVAEPELRQLLLGL